MEDDYSLTNIKTVLSASFYDEKKEGNTAQTT
jgi:hypothetical protein